MREDRTIWLSLTPEEALELFSRCLESLRDDNEHSRSVLKKLAEAVELIEPLPRAS